METGFDAKFLSREARACCRAERLTPRRFEVLNAARSGDYQPGDAEYPVLRVWNSRREITITNADLAYAAMYL